MYSLGFRSLRDRWAADDRTTWRGSVGRLGRDRPAAKMRGQDQGARRVKRLGVVPRFAAPTRPIDGQPRHGKDTGMLRLSLLLAAVACTIGTAGCTHCDTCDDFPIPCVGGNCGALTAPGTGTFTGYGQVESSTSTMVPPSPPSSPASPFAPTTAPSETATELVPAAPAAPAADKPATPAPAPDKPATSDKPATTVPALAPPVAPPGDAAASTPPLPLGPEGAPGSGS